MNSRKVLLGALSLAALIGGCATASHLPQLRPAMLPPSLPVVIPGPNSVRPPAFQKGIDIDAYTWRGEDISTAAQVDVSYITSLHANSVMISFPFFMSGPNSSAVRAGAATPTPSDLIPLIETAERAKLYVSLRPLLDEASLGVSRVKWVPADPAAWFASYQAFLLPYARMAGAEKVGEFFSGAEFSLFSNSPRWDDLDRALARASGVTIAFSNNDTTNLTSVSGGAAAVRTIDAYHPVRPPFTAGLTRFFKSLPRGSVISEVGIAAVPNAWRAPWAHHWAAKSLYPQEQALWFTSSCQAAAAAHLRGIYFWSLGLRALR